MFSCCLPHNLQPPEDCYIRRLLLDHFESTFTFTGCMGLSESASIYLLLHY